MNQKGVPLPFHRREGNSVVQKTFDELAEEFTKAAANGKIVGGYAVEASIDKHDTATMKGLILVVEHEY